MPTPRDAFINAACVPLDTGHASGTLDLAQSILTANPALAAHDIHTAAILGDDAAVSRFLQADPASATAKSPPREWDALTHLCFSNYLRLDPSRSAGFVRAARALLDAGASANTGWHETNHQSKPEWESVLYGAAGIAHHADLTRLLLEHGADPNNGEVTYHTPETYDNAALRAILDTRKLTTDSLAIMLVRKADWHDLEGLNLLLAAGADPNHMTGWGVTAFHQAIRRDNNLANIDAMLDRGADPTITTLHNQSATSIAIRRGRADVLSSLERRGLLSPLTGLDQLLAACARDDDATIRSISAAEPHLITQLRAQGGTLLAQFAGTGNTTGVARLLDLGIDINTPYAEGDSYFGIPRGSRALHVAAWRAHHDTLKLLIARGASIDEPDANGRTPLALAIRACTDSYWAYRRTPDSIKALLDAGASTNGLSLPTGYAEADALLAPRRS